MPSSGCTRYRRLAGQDGASLRYRVNVRDPPQDFINENKTRGTNIFNFNNSRSERRSALKAIRREVEGRLPSKRKVLRATEQRGPIWAHLYFEKYEDAAWTNKFLERRQRRLINKKNSAVKKKKLRPSYMPRIPSVPAFIIICIARDYYEMNLGFCPFPIQSILHLIWTRGFYEPGYKQRVRQALRDGEALLVHGLVKMTEILNLHTGRSVNVFSLTDIGLQKALQLEQSLKRTATKLRRVSINSINSIDMDVYPSP